MSGNKLKELFAQKLCLRIMEAVNALEAVIVRNAGTDELRFDGLWLSGLCHAAWKCFPDDGSMPIAEKAAALLDINRVAKLPVIVDCDTGGSADYLRLTIEELSGLASALVIEDKRGAKRNSLYGTEVEQEMEDIDLFSAKLRAVSGAAENADILLFARIESFITGESLEIALERAESYIAAGADGIVIHSIRPDAADVFAFAERFRERFAEIPLIMIPTVYDSFTFAELAQRGANAVIYANQLTRSAFAAMEKTAASILADGCSRRADEEYCVPYRKILDTIEG